MRYYLYENKKLKKALEAIRKRPGIYLGYSNIRGIFNIFRLIFKEVSLIEKSKVYLSFNHNKVSFNLENIDFELLKNLESNSSVFRGSNATQYMYSIYISLWL